MVAAVVVQEGDRRIRLTSRLESDLDIVLTDAVEEDIIGEAVIVLVDHHPLANLSLEVGHDGGNVRLHDRDELIAGEVPCSQPGWVPRLPEQVLPAEGH